MRLPRGSVPPAGQRKAHAPAVDPGLRHRGGFDHLVPDGRLEGGEPLDRFAHFLFGQPRRDDVHPPGARRLSVGLRVLSQVVLEIFHLAKHVGHRKSREARRFGMTQSRHQMAGTAGLRLDAALDHARERAVLLRKPVRRFELIVDLRLRVDLRAARQRSSARYRRKREAADRARDKPRQRPWRPAVEPALPPRKRTASESQHRSELS